MTIRIRELVIDPPLLLAPMAGLTHSALRRLILRFGGVGLLSTEMLSAIRVPQENPRLSPFLFRREEERPLSYQLLLSRLADAAPAVAALHGFGADAIDLNLGCPAPAIRRLGAGSRLMENPGLLRELVAKVRKLTSLPLTAKIRLGENLSETALKNLCLMLAGEGIDLITVHARLRGESFSRKPRWSWIAKVKSWVKVPVVANGGIFSSADAARCLEASGADGLMLGRGAVIRPWLFAEIARNIYRWDLALPEVRPAEVYQEFAELLVDSFLPERRLGRLKEFTHYFARNYPFGHRLTSLVQSCGSLEQGLERAQLFFARNEAGEERGAAGADQ
jgi:nifR3 family TIM-barrel protein